MSRLVVHLGLPKSGSTATQQFLSANRLVLARLGLHWCESLRGPNHVQLAVAATTQINHLSATVGVRSERDRARLHARVARRLGAEVQRHGTVLVSTEHLSSALTTHDEIDALKRLLADVADEVEFVGVVRRGDYWLPSSYSEAILNNKDLDFDDAFVRMRAPMLDHREFVSRWQEGFGADAISLVPMLETDKTEPNAVPLRVLSAVGISADATTWQTPARIVHPTMSARGTQLLRAVTPVLPDGGLRPGRYRAKVQAFVAARYPGGSVNLTPAAADELDRLGWRRSGIDELTAAVGDDWSRWREHPDADVRPLPQVTDDELRSLLDGLQEAGLARRAGTVLEERLRRVAVRLVRR